MMPIMKQGLTHLIFVVDRSSSMSSIASEMVIGYNNFIKAQKETAGECAVSFYQFDDQYDVVFERSALSEVKDLDNKTYVPRGSTALFDAMGRTINNYGKYLSDLPEDERPERILFVTITDGQNNASREFTLDQVANMVKHQTEVYKWDFVFLGSNIDSWAAGESFNIKASSTLQFANNAGSVKSAFDSLAKSTVMYRSCAVKADYSFEAADYAAQDDFLDGSLKSKNKAAQNKSSTTTTKK
jgi:hypothetical protein